MYKYSVVYIKYAEKILRQLLACTSFLLQQYKPNSWISVNECSKQLSYEYRLHSAARFESKTVKKIKESSVEVNFQCFDFSNYFAVRNFDGSYWRKDVPNEITNFHWEDIFTIPENPKKLRIYFFLYSNY